MLKTADINVQNVFFKAFSIIYSPINNFTIINNNFQTLLRTSECTITYMYIVKFSN